MTRCQIQSYLKSFQKDGMDTGPWRTSRPKIICPSIKDLGTAAAHILKGPGNDIDSLSEQNPLLRFGPSRMPAALSRSSELAEASLPLVRCVLPVSCPMSNGDSLSVVGHRSKPHYCAACQSNHVWRFVTVCSSRTGQKIPVPDHESTPGHCLARMSSRRRSAM